MLQKNIFMNFLYFERTILGYSNITLVCASPKMSSYYAEFRYRKSYLPENMMQELLSTTHEMDIKRFLFCKHSLVPQWKRKK